MAASKSGWYTVSAQKGIHVHPTGTSPSAVTPGDSLPTEALAALGRFSLLFLFLLLHLLLYLPQEVVLGAGRWELGRVPEPS